MYFKTKCESDCCGCGTCSNICPKNAISMKTDTHGFQYPIINTELCIHCGLCEKACIFNEKIKDTAFENRFFAVRSQDDDIVLHSSSGGMFTLMAEEIFSRGGIVYGVAYGDEFSVKHSRAENMHDAESFRTSKYVQSDTNKLYKSVHDDLANQKTVLVTGTPCQIAGLIAYLKHYGVDTSSLYTCDNICHGVSSPLVFGNYINCLNKYLPEGSRITSVNMRYKEKSFSRTIFAVHTQENSFLSEAKKFSFYKLYYNRVVYRQSCFNCKFVSYSRPGDLTIGDFWNNKKGSLTFDSSHGVNEVLINSAKGLELFEAIKKNAYYQEVTKEKAWQPHLEYPTQKPENYEEFWNEYLTSEDREQVMRKYLKVSPLFKVINFATPILRKTGLYTICGKLYKMVFVKKK